MTVEEAIDAVLDLGYELTILPTRVFCIKKGSGLTKTNRLVSGKDNFCRSTENLVRQERDMG